MRGVFQNHGGLRHCPWLSSPGVLLQSREKIFSSYRSVVALRINMWSSSCVMFPDNFFRIAFKVFEFKNLEKPDIYGSVGLIFEILLLHIPFPHSVLCFMSSIVFYRQCNMIPVRS